MSVWTEDSGIVQRYLDVCKRAVEDEEVFASFKTHPDYTTILEHLTKEQGNTYRNSSGNWGALPNRIYHSAHVNDSIGRAGSDIWTTGDFSPSTLRYMWMARVVCDLVKQDTRSSRHLRHCNVAEIGGGYGGLALVLSNPLTHWSFFDLPEPKALQNKFMLRAGARTTWDFPAMDSPRKYELLISTYALSEMGEDQFWQYMEHVVARSNMGFLVCNDQDHHVQKAIERSGLRPQISKDPAFESNYVVTWNKRESDRRIIAESARKYKGPARSYEVGFVRPEDYCFTIPK